MKTNRLTVVLALFSLVSGASLMCIDTISVNLTLKDKENIYGSLLTNGKNGHVERINCPVPYSKSTSFLYPFSYKRSWFKEEFLFDLDHLSIDKNQKYNVNIQINNKPAHIIGKPAATPLFGHEIKGYIKGIVFHNIDREISYQWPKRLFATSLLAGVGYGIWRYLTQK
ncbi:MAG: hypothetical protein WDZ41_04600 [Candidatus Babeliales bacterium]